MRGFLFLIGLALGGCAITGGQQQSQPSTNKYQLILNGQIDGVPFTGIGVGSAAPSHNLVITSPVTVNYFTLQSCHRSEQYPDFIKTGWFNNNKSKQLTYVEAPNIEDTGDCILRFCAFSKTVGAPPSACALIDFKSPRYTLPGENICNGARGNTTGTALCHTQVGLLQRFVFKTPVVIAPQVQDPSKQLGPYWIKGQCVGKFIDARNTIFEYQVPAEECVIIFMQRDKPHARAKLTVVPYDTPLYYGGGN